MLYEVITVSAAEMQAAYTKVDEDFLDTLERAIERIQSSYNFV